MLTLALLVVIALGAYLYFRLDDEAQRLSESMLARYCAPFDVRVASASFAPGRGVTIRGVEIVEQLGWRPARGVAQIEELRVEGDFDLVTLLNGKPVIRRIVAKRPRVAATLREDGSWNVADFRLPPLSGGPRPRVDVQDATLLLLTESAPASPVAISRLSLTLTPDADTGLFRLEADARETLAKTIRVNGRVSADGATLDATASVESLAVTPELIGALQTLGWASPTLPPLRGELTLTADARRDAGAPIDWNARFDWRGGELRVPRVERPLTETRLAGTAGPAGLQVDDGAARWGDARLRLVGKRNGWTAMAPAAVRLRIDDFDAATTPVDLLPGPAARAWRRFLPAGRGDVAIDLVFNGLSFAHAATIQVRDASFEDSERFPYRVDGASGVLLVNGGVAADGALPEPRHSSDLQIDLRAMADGAPITITGRLEGLGLREHPGEPRGKMPPGSIEIAGSGAPITPRLVGAIQEEEARSFIQSLHPAGSIDFRWWIERRAEEEEPRVAMDLRLVDCRMQYDRFPYPLSHVTGWVRQEDKRWTFTELRSRDAGGRTLVAGAGVLEPRDGSCFFQLQLRGEATPLDPSLHAALPPDAQQAWALLRPTGQIDFFADITKQCGQPEPSIHLTVRPHERSVAIHPPLSETEYRYRLERLDGRFEWTDGRATIRGARAEHGRTSFATDGRWSENPGGGWTLKLENLHADRLVFDRDLLLASTAGLRSVVEELNPRGGIDLSDSEIEVVHSGNPATPTQAKWRVQLNCHQVALDVGTPIDGLTGVIKLGGSCNEVSAVNGGELDLDSVFWNDLQLTNVRGPLWADSSVCLFGEGVARQLGGGKPEPIRASAYGGDVKLTARVLHGSQPEFGVKVDLTDVQVDRLSSEWLRRPETLHGLLNGSLSVQQRGANHLYGMTGAGDLTVTDADLYELPLLLTMLKYFRNRTPDNTAFNRLETKFTLQGNDITFQNLDLLGDAVSLYGKGTATLARDVDLTFASIVGRNDVGVPMLRALMSSASEQLLRLSVTGTSDNPQITREVLPAVGGVLEQLQTEFGGRVTTEAGRPVAPTRR
ncbi:AsmA-like C-terminal region-containing protein [Botrimarina sp.]|uniref:AsmA-like C-terminal region-containing protein n=1 Tax=Botrimarina sp. TaxID=2795802 RepID=UPI0032EB6142